MFFKGTVTICWREIIPVVKLAHSEAGGVVRVDAFVCTSVCKCLCFITLSWCIHVSLSVCGCQILYMYLNVHFYMFLFAERLVCPFIVSAKNILISFCVCMYFCCVCVFIIAKRPSSMMGSKWQTVVHSKQQRLAALEDRVLSEHRKTFLSLLMYL